MNYYLNLFSPETYEAFGRSDRTVSGFRHRQQNAANRILPGDCLVCYMTKLSRWIGILEVVNGPYTDDTAMFYPENDPFTVRFKVKEKVWLPIDKTIPIHENHIWDKLSFTKGQDKNTSTWTGKVRVSLGQLNQSDASVLEREIIKQLTSNKMYKVDREEYEKSLGHQIRGADRTVSVSIPENTKLLSSEGSRDPSEARQSIKIQALLADIGARMGMSIWIPRNDRGEVLREWQSDERPILDRLPLNYDDTTLKTIEQIDVLWLQGRAIIRAFEVEHTTAIYSGILRMADLLALQPNMDIKLHLVAPYERKNKVFQELKRPVFSLLERGPLSEKCSYLSYDSLREIASDRHLAHLSDSVLDDYSEEVE